MISGSTNSPVISALGADTPSLGGGDRAGQFRRDASEEGEEAGPGGDRRFRHESGFADQGGTCGADGGPAARDALSSDRKEYQNTVYDPARGALRSHQAGRAETGFAHGTSSNASAPS